MLLQSVDLLIGITYLPYLDLYAHKLCLVAHQHYHHHHHVSVYLTILHTYEQLVTRQ